MGLFSWIKNKYYDFRLSQADKSVDNREFDKAQLTYESLLGKQPYANVHLAKMLVANANSVNDKLNVLKRLLELRQYSTEESNNDYESVLNSYVKTMESAASAGFSSKRYGDAVELLSAIKNFRPGQHFSDKLNRYKAYRSFDIANSSSLSSVDYKDTVVYLKQISEVPVSDIKEFLKILEQDKRYTRGIVLLLQLLSVGSWIKDTIFNYVVEIISNNDSERKNVKKYSDFCNDKSVCKDSAVDLAKRAVKKALSKDYKTAVLFDSFAAEYLSADNAFNVDRCNHIVEELSSRADAKEIKSLLELAKSLKLSDEQIAKLTNRVNAIAVSANPPKAIAICRLFIGNQSFNKVYLEKSLSIAKAGERIVIDELRKVISQQTNESNLPDVLGSFVPYIPELEQEFVEAAIKVILSQKSKELLDRYWKIKNDSKFIKATVEKSFDAWEEFGSHIVERKDFFLCDKDSLKAFCATLKGNKDLEVTLLLTERLIKSGADVEEFYVSTILENSREYTSAAEAIDLVNRGLNTVINEKLMAEKKRLISKLIAEKQFERAEKEIQSILNKDDEAPTLLAELYFNLAKNASEKNLKVSFLEKVLTVEESYQLRDRFLNCLQETLSSLSEIAKAYFKDNQSEEAYRIASRIKSYWAHWIPLYVWLRELSKESGLSLNSLIKYDGDTLSEICKNCPSAKEYSSDEILNLWREYVDNIVKKTSSQPKDKAIASVAKARKAVLTFAPKNYEDSKQEELLRIIAKYQWELAIEFEHEQSYKEAISLYDEIVAEGVQSFQNRAELRSLICYVKEADVNEQVEERIKRALDMRSYQALREDLAYRFSIYLLQQTRPSDAQSILTKYLPDDSELLSLCENIFIKEAENKLTEFNQLAERLNSGKMSVADATDFKADIRSYKKQITEKLSDLGRPFSQISHKVESYILSKMFDEEMYMELLTKLMQENPNYIENNTDFRNIAIASLGIIESDNSDETLVKRAIATFLTAIFCDRLFVQSLDYTSWDDKYTFTLDDSLGQTSYDDYDELPENVNFDSPVDNVNVAIKDVQNSLITRVESAVRKYHPDLEKFYNDEKDALTKLIELRLDQSYILASPFLCRTLASARMSIENAFEYELNQNYDNHEDVVALGSAYGFSGGEYSEYNKGFNALLFCKSSLSSKPAVAIDGAFTPDKVAAIKRFKRLFADLKSAVGTAMNEDVRSKMDFKKFLDKYEVICKVVNDNTLSLTCSNYVNGEVVHLLNEDKMELRVGVGYMVRIYNIAPSNFQAKKNLEGILCGLAIKAETDGRSLDKNALAKAMSDTGNAFSEPVDDAKIQATLSVIVDKVNSGTMKNNTALNEVFAIYQKSPNNERICENLATICEICIFEYIINGSVGSSGVKTTLNKLARNMSTTFRLKARKLGKTFNETWNKIPFETKNLMCGGFDLERSLNPSGEALKLGLQYLKKFGSVNQSSDVDDPFSPLARLSRSGLFRTELPDLPL